MYKIDEIKMLRLGQRDENLARSLPFDCSDWLEQYPEASIHILFRRPGESAIVPISTTLEGTTLTWLIHDYEVGKTGIGNAEFRAVDTAGLRRKSRIIPCSIEETLLGDDETVLYTQDQVDETLAHISEAAQAAQAAKASEEAAALSAQNAAESATSAGTAANVAVGARDAAQAAQNAAETAQHQAEAAQSGVHADAVAAEQAKVAAQAAQASAQGAASQASADRTAAESARADAEAAAEHAEAVVEGIDQAGADQVAAVNAAGATQVGNVTAAGTTQVNAVQAKGTQVINSIPADYSALTNEVTGLKSALGKYTGVETVPFVPGGYIATNGTKAYINTIVSSAGHQYLVAECKEGDMVHVTGAGGSTPRLWAFVDADDNVLDKAGDSLSATDLALTAPEGTKYLIVNDRNSTDALVTIGKYVPDIASGIDRQMELFVFDNSIPVFNDWEQGTINQNTGAGASSTTICRTGFFEPPKDGKLNISNPDNQTIKIFYYKQDNSYLGYKVITPFTETVISASHKHRITNESTGNVASITTTFSFVADETLNDKIKKITDTVGESFTLVASNNLLDPSKITAGKYMAKNGNPVTLANSAYSDRIPVNENDVVRFYNNIAAANMSYITAFDGDVAKESSGATNVSSYTVPSGISHIVISYNTSQLTNPFLTINYEPTEYEPYFNPYYVNTDKSTQDKLNVESENLFNTATYTDGKYVSPSNGNTISDATMCCTDFIPVAPGDVLTFGNGMLGASVSARFICAYNIAKTVLSASGSSASVTSYTVPSNVYFVRISFSKTSYAKGFFPWISKTGTIKYMPYYSGTVRDLAKKNYSGISGIVNWPLASFPAYIRNQLSYKPLGTLTKGYVLLTTDDGQAPLATYTLPMLISKGVPVTMGVMAESEILNNETYAAVFVDAVENHGCSVAAHGAQAYTQYSEYQLNKFFDEQDALISQFGLTIDGAICPTHAINETVKAVAGGRYGVVRTAASNGVPSYGGNNYLAGPRSNLYALPSESIIGYDLNYHKAAMDLAKDNHWIRVLYWHDDDLTDQYKTLLEGTIDYALSIGLEFITFKDLANNLII